MKSSIAKIDYSQKLEPKMFQLKCFTGSYCRANTSIKSISSKPLANCYIPQRRFYATKKQYILHLFFCGTQIQHTGVELSLFNQSKKIWLHFHRRM